MTKQLAVDFAACFVPIFVLIHLDLLYFVNQMCYLQENTESGH
jgi:hypothetical protein